MNMREFVAISRRENGPEMDKKRQIGSHNAVLKFGAATGQILEEGKNNWKATSINKIEMNVTVGVVIPQLNPWRHREHVFQLMGCLSAEPVNYTNGHLESWLWRSGVYKYYTEISHHCESSKSGT